MGRNESDTIEQPGFDQRGSSPAPAGPPSAPRHAGTPRPGAVETPHGYQLYL